MDILNSLRDRKKLITLALSFFLALTSFSFLWIIFSNSLKKQHEELETKKLETREANQLFSQKEDFEKKWEALKSNLNAGPHSEEALNLWVKDLLSYATQEGITFSKLEPQGIKEQGTREEVRLYLEFQGDIRKLAHFIYHLIEKDPLSKVHSFALKKEDSEKNFSYQLTLGKTLL